MRLSSRATQDGAVEVQFLHEVVVLTTDQARELQRELTHSIALADHGRPRLNLVQRDELTYGADDEPRRDELAHRICHICHFDPCRCLESTP